MVDDRRRAADELGLLDEAQAARDRQVGTQRQHCAGRVGGQDLASRGRGVEQHRRVVEGLRPGKANRRVLSTQGQRTGRATALGVQREAILHPEARARHRQVDVAIERHAVEDVELVVLEVERRRAAGLDRAAGDGAAREGDRAVGGQGARRDVQRAAVQDQRRARALGELALDGQRAARNPQRLVDQVEIVEHRRTTVRHRVGLVGDRDVGVVGRHDAQVPVARGLPRAVKRAVGPAEVEADRLGDVVVDQQGRGALAVFRVGVRTDHHGAVFQRPARRRVDHIARNAVDDQRRGAAGVGVEALGDGVEIGHLHDQRVVARTRQVDALEALEDAVVDRRQIDDDARAHDAQDIGTGAGVDLERIRGVEDDRVVARAADDDVVAARAIDRVVALAADQDLVGARAGQAVVAGGAEEIDLVGEVAPEDDVAGAGAGAAAVVERRADNQVVEAVAVDVARRRDGIAGMVVSDLGVDPEAADTQRDVIEVDRREAARRAEHDIGGAAVEKARAVVVVSADDHIVEAVAVDVAGSRHREAGIIARRLTDDLEAAGARRNGAEVDRRQARSGAEQDIGRTGIGAAGVVVERRRDDDVGETVAIDVASRGDRISRQVVGRLADELEAAGAVRDVGKVDGRRRRRRAEHDVGRAGIRVSAEIITVCPDDDVGEAVAVHIAGRGDPAAGLVDTGLADDLETTRAAGDVRKVDRRQATGHAEHDIGRAGGSVAIRRDEKVVDAVAVDIAGGGDGIAGIVIRRLANNLETAGAGRDVGKVDRRRRRRRAEHDIGSTVL